MKENNDKQMAIEIAKRINKLGGKTFFVGGCVRDEILGSQSKDIDIEVHGVTPKQLRNVLDELGGVKTQGSAFGVYNLKGYGIDIAQPRKERATGRGHRDFEVFVDPFIGYEKAAERRDFTCNAIMKDVLTGEFVDPFGGIEDCKNGIIRHVNDDTFKEDPLRVLRGAQFASRFNFTIASDTLQLMKKMNLLELSKERIYGELQKAMMKSERPSIFFEVLKEANQLKTWFPELKEMIGCEQSPKWHPEGDVWNHTMKTIDEAAKTKNKTENPEYFMIAALCHDLGKPGTKTVDEKGNIHTYGHDIMGVPVAEKFLSRINNDKGLKAYVLNMVQDHMKIHIAFNNHVKEKRTNKIFDQSIAPKDLILLTEADSLGGDGKTAKEEREFAEERLATYKERMRIPEVTGADLIKLGMKPGPQFSEILKEAHKLHLSGVSKETALKGIKTKNGLDR